MAEFKHDFLIPVETRPTACVDCAIRRLALFKGVDDKELEWTQQYRSGQFKVPARREILKEGTPGDYLFTLYHGWAIISKTLDSGKRQILRIALPGDILGFQSDMTANMIYSVSSLTEVVLCGLTRDTMPELFKKYPNVVKRLIELSIRDMSICQSSLMVLGHQSAIERIAFFCAELFYRIQGIFKNNVDHTMNFPLSQEDIGDATGLTKIHVNRTLRTLREQGVLEITSRKLIIHDLEETCRLGQFDPSTVHTHSLY